MAGSDKEPSPVTKTLIELCLVDELSGEGQIACLACVVSAWSRKISPVVASGARLERERIRQAYHDCCRRIIR